MAVEYRNFDIHIGQRGTDDRYPVTVTGTPSGQQTRQTVWQTTPLTDPDFLNLLSWLRRFLAEPEDVKALGFRLRQLLFPKEIWDLLVANRAVMRNQGKRLRIRLLIEPKELSELPWEYCWDDETAHFFTLNAETPMVRYIREPFEESDMKAPDTVKVLLVTASPSDLKPLDHEIEARRVKEALEPLGKQIELLEPLHNATASKLQATLREKEPHILHFIGHGVFHAGQGSLALEKDDGTMHPLDAEQVMAVFRNSTVKLAVLNACNTARPGQQAAIMGVAPAFVRAGLPAVVAMQSPVLDETALLFARLLYSYLSDGSLDVALTEMRIGAYISGRDKVFWGIPVLFMRTPNGIIWHPEEAVGDPAEAGVVDAQLRSYLEVIARRTNPLPTNALPQRAKDLPPLPLESLFVNVNARKLDDGETVILLPPDLKRSLRQVGMQTIGTGEARAAATGLPPDIAYGRYESTLGHIYHHRRLLLLGDPGSGKSTLLRYLALTLAQVLLSPREPGWRSRLRWPLFISAGSGDSPGPSEYVAQEAWSGEYPLPIYVDLREFAASDAQFDSPLALWHFVSQRLQERGLGEVEGPLRVRAKQRGVIFLLDSLDAVPADRRGDVWRAISSLTSGPYGGNRWVVASRNFAYRPEDVPSEVAVRQLQPLGDEQIDQFIRNWFDFLVATGKIGRSESAKATEKLRDATRRKNLNRLAQNPLLLTVMALIQTFEGGLPEARAKLYQACGEVMLLQSHGDEGARNEPNVPEEVARLGLTPARLERFLWAIAWEGQKLRAAQARDGQMAKAALVDRTDPVLINEMRVMQIAREQFDGSWSKAERLLRYVEQHGYVLPDDGTQAARSYRLLHSSIQEYLAACHLAASRRFPQEAASLAAQGEMWREVLILATGTLVHNRHNLERALDGIAGVLPWQLPAAEELEGWSRIWLAGEMMLVIGRAAADQDIVGQEVLPRLRQQLAELLQQGRLMPKQRATAGDALSQLGDPRPGVISREPEMIPILGGPFQFGDQTLSVGDFAIARYLVTNAQFAFFVADGGYTAAKEHCWTDEGWKYRLEQRWEVPSFWHDKAQALANKPVVGISWYEAVAYARWLSEVTGRPFRLPTEVEWERAARHTDGRLWPWGNEWQDGIVNAAAADVGRTTAVGSFPHGKAVCGAEDMAGNVWEWCSTRFADEKDSYYPFPYEAGDGREDPGGDYRVRRVLRGGAFGNLATQTQTTSRYPPTGVQEKWGQSDSREADIGFRLVEVLPTVEEFTSLQAESLY